MLIDTTVLCVYMCHVVPMLLGLLSADVVGRCGFGSDHLLGRRRGRFILICGLVWRWRYWFIVFGQLSGVLVWAMLWTVGAGSCTV